MKRAICALVLILTGCGTTIRFQKPPPSVPDSEAAYDKVDEGGPAGLYEVEPIPADVDPALAQRMEHVNQDVYSMDVCVGEAVGWAFRHDPNARVKISFGESRFDSSLEMNLLLNSSYENTYTLYTVVSIDGGAPQSVVASGRASTWSPLASVPNAVATCVRDLHSKVNNLLRVTSSPAQAAPASESAAR